VYVPTFVLAALAFSVTVAEDGLEVAKKYADFWQPIVGTWEVTTEIEGEEEAGETTPALLRFERYPLGLHYVSSTIVNGQEVGHGIHAYDPSRKCWHFVGYGVPPDDDSPLHGTTWLMINLEEQKQVKTGTTFMAEGRDVMPDGKVVETRARWTAKLVEKDRMEFVFTEATRDGEPRPDVKTVLQRAKRENKEK
jgi:hypothetical protein